VSKIYYPYHVFDPAAHAANDAQTRQAVSGWLAARGWTVNESGKYDIDLDARRPDGSICHCEVERRSTARWTGEFPFATVELPLRKRELLGDPYLVYLIGNCNLTRWIAVSGQTVAEQGREVDKLTRDGRDRVISVPVEFARQGRF
jgi:hypothetical protein